MTVCCFMVTSEHIVLNLMSSAGSAITRDAEFLTKANVNHCPYSHCLWCGANAVNGTFFKRRSASAAVKPVSSAFFSTIGIVYISQKLRN